MHEGMLKSAPHEPPLWLVCLRRGAGVVLAGRPRGPAHGSIPPAFLARAADPVALEAALTEAKALIDEAPLSQNDVPTLLLALLSAHPGLRALPADQRWYTLGGQVTSPYFAPGGDPSSYILGINGVSELFTLDRTGARVGSYEDSVFLKTRADRYRVTPRLIPVTAALIETMKSAK